MKPKPAAGIITLCFLLCAASSVVFVAAYVLNWGSQVLGGTLAGGIGALAVGLLLWSSQLLPGGEFVETREPLPPPLPEQTAFVATAQRGGSSSPTIVRRTLVLGLFGLFAAAVVPLRSLIPSSSTVPQRALATTSWRGGGKRLMTPEGRLIRLGDVPVGTELTAFPEGEPDAYYATAVVVRVRPADIALLNPDFARYTVDGVIAFSKLCTHAGCPVGLYLQESRQLFCPCHQSVFDVLHAGQAIAGPASRPLPQLPLGVDDQGYLIALGDFRGQPGPTYWTSYWRPYRLGASQ